MSARTNGAGSTLPAGWAQETLGDYLTNHDRLRVPLKAADRKKRQGDYPYYGASGVIDTIDDYIFDGDYLLLGEDGANLLSRSKPIAFQAHGQFWVNNHAHIFQTPAGCPLAFVEHFLNSINLAPYITGTAQPKLPQAAMNKIPLRIAPADEQLRIVDYLETEFSRLDAAVAGLKRVQANLKRYRASVLKAAVEGRLVPTEAELARAEGRTYEPASELLARILEERRARWEAAELASMKAKGKPPRDDKWKSKYKEPAPPDTKDLPELPEGWCWATVDQLGAVQGGIQKGKKRNGSPELREVPYLRVANVQRGFLDLGEVKTILASPEEIDALRLEAGDVLFNEGGDRDKLGRGWVWNNEVDGCIHQNHVFRARLYSTEMRSKFLSWYGNGSGQKYFFDEGKQTTNLASLNSTKLRSLPVPVPPAREQLRVESEMERLLSETDASGKMVERSVLRCTRLRQSILKWAFEGKLVDQDPNDEPASVLIERIRAEREATGPAKKRLDPKTNTKLQRASTAGTAPKTRRRKKAPAA